MDTISSACCKWSTVQTLRHAGGRLAWAIVTGGSSWCAETAVCWDIAASGHQLRRQVLSRLDAWLHANAYTSRTFYGSLLDRVKASRHETRLGSKQGLRTGLHGRRACRSSG